MTEICEARTIHGECVHGVDVDPATRCGHYHASCDIIAIRFKCCSRWYPCFECHAACADHPPETWPAGERDATAVLCGACGQGLTIAAYLGCDSTCPACQAPFNPGCAHHYHLYFAAP